MYIRNLRAAEMGVNGLLPNSDKLNSRKPIYDLLGKWRIQLELLKGCQLFLCFLLLGQAIFYRRVAINDAEARKVQILGLLRT